MSATEAVPGGAPSGTMTRLRSYLELGKLRLSSLAIFAVVAGLYLGSMFDPSGRLIAATTLGTLLVAMAGNALNMYLERDFDRHMERTRGRPLPSGRLRPAEVLAFGVVTAAIGLTILAAETNLLATALCATIFVTYVGIYTPMKRRTPLNTIVGAVPGALPPVVGYAAASGRVDAHAAILFAIVFVWQIPHFLAISWRYRDDYARGGMKMLAVTDRTGEMMRRQMLVYTLALIPISLLPFLVRIEDAPLSGEAYAAAALLLGLGFLTPVVLAAVLRWESAVRATFVASIVYLPLLFLVMVLDRA